MTVSKDYVSQNVFDALGYTGNVYYCRIVSIRDSQVWNDVLDIMDWVVPWIDSAMALVDTYASGAYPVIIPALLPAGIYDVVVYRQAGSDPANTDDVEKQWIEVKGGIFGF